MTTVTSARRDWEQGYRAFLADARGLGGDALHAQLEVLTDQVKRRLGAVFTLDELASTYATAEPWAREALAERLPHSGWERTVTVVLDAAFHLYSRGARDHVP